MFTLREINAFIKQAADGINPAVLTKETANLIPPGYFKSPAFKPTPTTDKLLSKIDIGDNGEYVVTPANAQHGGPVNPMAGDIARYVAPIYRESRLNASKVSFPQTKAERRLEYATSTPESVARRIQENELQQLAADNPQAAMMLEAARGIGTDRVTKDELGNLAINDKAPGSKYGPIAAKHGDYGAQLLGSAQNLDTYRKTLTKAIGRAYRNTPEGKAMYDIVRKYPKGSHERHLATMHYQDGMKNFMQSQPEFKQAWDYLKGLKGKLDNAAFAGHNKEYQKDWHNAVGEFKNSDMLNYLRSLKTFKPQGPAPQGGFSNARTEEVLKALQRQAKGGRLYR